MKCFLFLFLNLSIVPALNCQRQADNWVWGLCSPENTCPEPFGTTVMQFDDTGIVSIKSKFYPFRFTKGSTSISDAQGNLLLSFNGKYLFDSSGAITDSLYNLNFDEMPIGYKAALFLNVPGTTDKYCLFNSYTKPLFEDPSFNAYDTSFYYSEFKTLPSGIETVIRKQAIELDSSAAGTITAVRHGNGRDWWVLKSSIYQDKFYMALLNSDGFQFTPVYTPVEHIRHYGGGWNIFSRDGTKFLNYLGGVDRRMFIYDFNRCTGQFSNPVMFDMSLYYSDYENTPPCLSPDATKVYCIIENLDLGSYGLSQFDLQTQTMSHIADSTGSAILSPNSRFALAPYARINANESTPFFSIIHNPNANIQDIDYEPAAIEFLNYGYNGSRQINYANFRLGPSTNSVCDTLSVGMVKTDVDEFLSIYPNPVINSLTIDLQKSSFCFLTLKNMLGQTLWQGKTNGQKTILTTEIEQLEKGIFWLEIQDLKTGKRAGKKFVKQ